MYIASLMDYHHDPTLTSVARPQPPPPLEFPPWPPATLELPDEPTDDEELPNA